MKNVNNRKVFIWNMLGVSVNSFLSLFLTILVTRYNGIVESGIFSFSFSVALVIYSIAVYGGRVFQSIDKNNNISDGTYISAKIITSIFSLLILLIFVALNNYEWNKILLIFILSIAKILEAFSENCYGVIQRNNRLDIVGKSLFSKSVVSLILFFITLFLTKNIYISSITIFITNLVYLLFYDIPKSLQYTTLKINFNKNIFKFLKQQKYLFLFNFIILLILNVPRYIADIKLNDELLGYFGIIIMIPTILTLFAQFIVQPELVKLSEYYTNKDYKKYIYTIKRQMKYVIIFGILCMFGVYMIAPEILSFIYKLPFENYRFILIFVVMGGIFNTLTTILSTALTVMKKTKSQLNVYLIVLVFCFFLSTLLSTRFSIYGIFYSYLISMIFQFIIFIFLFYEIYKGKKNKKVIKYIYIGNPYPSEYINNPNFNNEHFSIADDKAQNSLIKGLYKKCGEDLSVLTISQDFDYSSRKKFYYSKKEVILDCGVKAIAIGNIQKNSILYYTSILFSTIINLFSLMIKLKRENKNVKFILITYTPAIYHCLGTIIANMFFDTKKICFLVGPILFPNYKGINKLVNKMSILTVKSFDATITYVAKSSQDYTNKPYIEILYSLTKEEINDSKSDRFKKTESSKKIITYTGALEFKNGIEIILSLVPLLPNNIVINIYGDGTLNKKVSEISNKYPKNVKYFGKVDRSKISSILKNSDLLLLFRTCNNKIDEYFSKYAASGKLTEYLLSGVPILCFENASLNKSIKEYLNFVDSTNADNIIKSIINLFKPGNYKKALEKAKNGKKFIIENANEEYQNEKIFDFIKFIATNEG